VSDFFDDISKGGREGGDALDFLIGTLAGAIRTIGLGIGIAEAWFGVFEDISGLVGGLATGNFGLFTDRFMAMGDDSDTTASLDQVGGRGGGLHCEAARDLSDAFDKAFGSTMNVDQAATRFASDLYGLKGALDSHTKAIDLNSAAGPHNREVIQGAIGDAKAHRDAMIAQAGGANASKAAIDAANASYETDIAKLRGHGGGGYLRPRVRRPGRPVQREYRRASHRRLLPGLPVLALGRARANRWGGITSTPSGAAVGEGVLPDGPARYAFAEPATGGEAFVPRFGDYRRSTSILDQASRWYGGRFVAGGMGGGGGPANVVNLTVNAGIGGYRRVRGRPADRRATAPLRQQQGRQRTSRPGQIERRSAGGAATAPSVSVWYALPVESPSGRRYTGSRGVGARKNLRPAQHRHQVRPTLALLDDHLDARLRRDLTPVGHHGDIRVAVGDRRLDARPAAHRPGRARRPRSRAPGRSSSRRPGASTAHRAGRPRPGSPGRRLDEQGMPRRHVRARAQQLPPLAFGQTAPHTVLDPVVQRLDEALRWTGQPRHSFLPPRSARGRRRTDRR
jgi:hypothetical protein